MRNRAIRALVVLGLTGLMVGALVAPASAGRWIPEEAIPTLTVTKEVVAGDNPVTIPDSEDFTVQVQCINFYDDDDSFTDTLVFNADGSTHSADGGWVDNGNSWSLTDWDLFTAYCTITEQASGATTYLDEDPTYTCEFSNLTLVDEYKNADALDEIEEPDEGGCQSDDGTDPAVVYFEWARDGSCPDPEDELTAEYCKWCAQDAVITVTNTLAQVEPPAPTPEPVPQPAQAAAAVVAAARFTG